VTVGSSTLFVTNNPGIYAVQFYAPASSNPTTADRPIPDWTDDWGAGTAGTWFARTDIATIAAWDATVFSGSTRLSGRVWSNSLALDTGILQDSPLKYSYVATTLLTKDGYEFDQKHVVSGISYAFFANNRGLIDNSTGQASFKSWPQTGNYSIGATSQDVTHKIFFNIPNTDLPQTADRYTGAEDWLLAPPPTPPPTVENLNFTGYDHTPNQAAGSVNPATLTAGSGGGTFTFTNPTDQQLSIQILLKFSANGQNTDRILYADAPPGQGSTVWDGLDGSGNPIKPGSTQYTVNANLLAGIVHFPFFDVEVSSRLNVTRLTTRGPSAAQWPTTLLYWDHSMVAAPTASAITPLVNLGGLDSISNPAMRYQNSNVICGDKKWIDQWTYLPSGAPYTKNLQIVSADVRIKKTADFTPGKGGAVAYTITVDNADDLDIARAIRVQDTVANSISNVTWTCTITKPGTFSTQQIDPATGQADPGPSQCSSNTGAGAPVTAPGTAPVLTSNGTGNTLDTKIDLRAGGQAVFKIRGTMSTNPVSPLPNTATASRGADADDPDNTNNTST
ncbi:MAG: hypothetical protein ACRESC_05490, partial [Gammaproteobacteria bacterium]